MTTPALHTDRLVVDGLVPEDAPALHAVRSHPDVARVQGWVPASVEDARDFIARNAAAPFGRTGAWSQLAVRVRNTGDLVGDLGVHVLGDDGRQAELGVTIAPAHQRRGLAAEAARAVLEHLFTTMGMHRVIASVDPRNVASVALLERLGMRREAWFRQSLYWKGAWVDDVVYALLGAEWRARDADPRLGAGRSGDRG